jgi:large subunit ribosomal protein L10
MTSHTRKWKEAQVEELQQLADKYPVIAVASIKNFPGALAKELRKKLQGKAVVKVSKTRAIALAFGKSKAETKELESHLKGSVAVIFTEMNPFELYAFLKKNKVSMPAKSGVIAPNDIVIPAGDTGLPPGPALSDLKAAGLKTVMQGPTISIAEDKLVTKKGETVSEAVAGALGKLGIKPMKIGLNVVACLEKSQVFLADVLDIDTDKVRKDFASAARNALNLAVEVSYFTKETVSVLVSKGYKNAKAVALEASILNKETASEILGKAKSQAAALKALVKDKPEQAKEEKKEEKKEQPAEKKEEAKEKRQRKSPKRKNLLRRKKRQRKSPKRKNLLRRKKRQRKSRPKGKKRRPRQRKKGRRPGEKRSSLSLFFLRREMRWSMYTLRFCCTLPKRTLRRIQFPRSLKQLEQSLTLPG